MISMTLRACTYTISIPSVSKLNNLLKISVDLKLVEIFCHHIVTDHVVILKGRRD